MAKKWKLIRRNKYAYTLDIENKKFSKQMMSGYSVDEVDEFLDEITADYEKLYKESAEAKIK